jgi:uncharacterized UPF0146 family protein
VTPGLVARLAEYDRLVEVGIGQRPGVAAALAERGRTVTTTDIRDRPTPGGVAFVRDDATDPDPAVYRGADAVYALRCPPELQRPLRAGAPAAGAGGPVVARDAGADCLFTTLGADPAVVPATPTTLAETTLFRATDGPAAARTGGPAGQPGTGEDATRRGGGSP